MSDPIFAFVLMPFDPAFEDVYKIGIREAAEAARINAERLDDQIYAEGMLDRVYRQIEAADVIVADMSGRNPNVFYEVGYAHAKEKLCILITNDADSIPFDLKHRRHIVYSSIAKLREELERHLIWAKQEIENVRNTQIRAALTASGSLETTSYKAEATVEMRIDLHNDSQHPSSEIYGLYAYTGTEWNFEQDGVECPSSSSDIAGYKFRYQVRPPNTKLAPKSWAQIKLVGTRVLAYKWKGDEIKKEYSLTGTTLLRLMTSKGNVDYELPTEVTVEELPF